MTDPEFRARVLADIARLEVRLADLDSKLDSAIERLIRLEERVTVRAALIGALVSLVGTIGWALR